MAGLTLEGDDSEEEERKRNEVAFAERQKKAVLEREEKQRKYAEVRERLFGSQKTTSRESSTDNRNTPNRTLVNNDSRTSSRKGRSRNNRDNQPSSSTDQSPARQVNQTRQLFDPSYDAKPKSESPKPTFSKEEQPIRMPRGPDGSGRGGFGFAAARGGKSDA